MMLVNLLDRYSIIEILGEDHLDFLQGQLTNDVKKNEKSHTNPTQSHTNPTQIPHKIRTKRFFIKNIFFNLYKR